MSKGCRYHNHLLKVSTPLATLIHTSYNNDVIGYKRNGAIYYGPHLTTFFCLTILRIEIIMITKIMQTLKYNSRSNFMKTLPPPKPSLKDPKAHAQLVIYRTRLKSKMTTSLPHFASGEVVKGFGRGSKQLGIPTANFPTEVVQRLPGDISTGVYFGWAQVESSPIYKMVMSIGWNPFYKNKEKSMETHIIHKFEDDFYGKTLKVAMLGYIRPELDFSSIEELKETIWSDIRKAEKKLELSEYQEHKDTTFFSKVLNADDCIK